MVETALALLRLALERGWTVGLFLLVFCGGALAASHYGVLVLPETVKQWSGAGVLFGVATIIVSLAANFTAYVGRKLREVAQRRADKAEAAAEAEHVLANLAACNDEDIAVLQELLPRGRQRIEVYYGSAAGRLIQMGALVVREHLGTRSICELHPAIVAKKDELLHACRRRLQANLQQTQPQVLNKFD